MVVVVKALVMIRVVVVDVVGFLIEFVMALLGPDGGVNA